MNKVYKVIWNASVGAWVAVSELATAKGKSSKSVRVMTAAGVLLGATVTFSANAFAAGTELSSCKGNDAAKGGGPKAVAIGCNAEAKGDSGIYDRKNPYNPKKAGSDATLWNSTDGSNTAIGSGAKAGSSGTGLATAVGTYAEASNVASIAVGVAALSSGNSALAIGRQSAATADYAQAIGNVSAATGKGSLAVGHSATAKGNRSIAIGSADIDKAGSTDTKQQGTDYQTKDQTLSEGKDSIAIGAAAKASKDNALAVGAHAKAEGEDSTAMGYKSTATGSDSFALGREANATANNAFAMGANSAATGENAYAMGSKSKAAGKNAFAMGGESDATGENALAIGGQSNANAMNSIAVGVNAKANFANSVALGTGAEVNHTNSIAIGENSKTNVYTGTAFLSEENVAAAKAKGAVSFGTEGNERRLQNVAAGAKDTDGVNVSQLKKHKAITDKTGGDISTHLGGGAKFDPKTGAITAPTYKINNKTYTNVGDALLASQVDVKEGKNVKVTTKVNGDGSKEFTVATAAEVDFDKVTVGGITLDKKTGDITGLSNKDLSAGDFAKKGRAATEEQLKLVKDKADVTDNFAVKYDKNTDGTVNRNKVTFGGTETKSNQDPKTGYITTTGGTQLTNVASAGDYTNSANASNGVNAGDLNNAVKDVTNKGLNFSANTGDAVNKKLGETLAIKGGLANGKSASAENIRTVTNDKGELEVQLAKNLTGLESLGVGNTTINNGGLTITGGPSITTDGIKAGGKVIKDVADGVNGKDAVNKDQLDKAAAASKTEVVKGKNIKVTENKAKDGHSIYTVETDSVVDFDKVTVGGVTLDKKTGDITGLSNKDLSAGDFAKKGRAATEEQLKLVNDKADATDNFAVKYDKNTDGTVNRNKVTFGGTEAKSNQDPKTGYITTTGGTQLTNVASAGDYTKVENASNGVNAGDLNNAVKDVTNKGLNFSANTGDVVNKKLGETLAIKGGLANGKSASAENIRTVTNDEGELEVQLAKNLTGLESLSVGNTTINNGGLTITGGPSITTDGIKAGGKVIKDVADGVNGKDAVNKDQLDKAAAASKTEVVKGKNIKVTENKAKDGHSIYTVETDSVVDFDKVTVGGITLDKKTGDITGLSNKDLSAGDFAKKGRAATEEQLKLVNDKAGVTDNFAVKYDKNTDGTVNRNKVTFGGTEAKSNQDPKTGYITTTGGTQLTNVASAGDYTNSANASNGVNAGDLNNAVKDVTNKGLNFSANTGDVVNKKLGETLAIKGGLADDKSASAENIRTVTNDKGELEVQLAKNLTGLESVSVEDGSGNKTYISSTGTYVRDLEGNKSSMTVKGTVVEDIKGNRTTVSSGVINIKDDHGTTIVKGNGLTITGGPSITDKGIDAADKKVINVANGDITATSKDAVNGSQIHNISNSIKKSIGGDTVVNVDGSLTTSNVGNTGKDNIHDAIDTVNKTANKGWNLSANGTDQSQVKPGDAVDFASSDSNIKVSKDGNNIKVDLSKDLIGLNSIQIGDTTINNGGLTIKGGPSITAGGINAGGKVIKDVADGVNGKDAVNKDQLDKVSAASQVDVKEGKNVKVKTKVNGDGSKEFTVATDSVVDFDKVTVGGITLDKKTGDITGLSNKNLSGPNFAKDGRAATEEQLVAAANAVANVIGGQTDNRGATIVGADIGNTGKTTIHDAIASVRTDVKAGENITVDTITHKDGSREFTVATKKDAKFDSITLGDTLINNGGLTIKGGPSITAGGINAGGKVIKGVADGVNGKDAVNKDQLDKVSAAAKTDVKQGKNINVKRHVNEDGSQEFIIATAAEVDFDKVTVGGITLDKKTGDITGLGNTKLGAADFATKGRAATEEQLNYAQNNFVTILGGNAINKGGNVTITNIGNTGKDTIHEAISSINDKANNANQGWNLTANGKDQSTVKPGETVDFANKDGNINVSKDGNNVKVDLAKDIDLSEDGSIKIGDTTINNDGLVIAGGPSVTKDGIDAGDKKVTGVADGDIAKGSQDAINGGQLHDALEDINKNVTEAKSTVSGGDNITVKKTQNDDGSTNYEVATAKDVKFDSVTSGNINTDKITVGGKDGVTIDNSGINAGNKKVTGVADGTIAAGSKEAVNGGQLNTTNTNVSNYLGGGTKFENGEWTGPQYNINNSTYNNVGDALSALDDRSNQLNNKVDNLFQTTNQRIDNVEKRANAGIAAAMALETAPYVAGKWSYAAAAAHHGGENAVGITLRKTADNGRWSLTGGIAAASEGDPSFRIGISGVIN